MKKAGIILILLCLSLSLSLGTLYINDVLIPEPGALPAARMSEQSGRVSGTVYIYANGQRIAKVEHNKTFYFHNDHLGSATIITNETGQVVEEEKYDPFGVELAGSSKIGYNSKELDKDTELNYYGARYYGAEFGRFTTPDTMRGNLANPQSLNLYVYTLNNPLKYMDPSGNQELTINSKGYEEVYRETFNQFPGIIQKGLSFFGYSPEEVVLTQMKNFAATGLTVYGWRKALGNKAQLSKGGLNRFYDLVSERFRLGKVEYTSSSSFNPFSGVVKLSIEEGNSKLILEDIGAAAHEFYHYVQFLALKQGKSNFPATAAKLSMKGDRFWAEYSATRVSATINRMLGFSLNELQISAQKGYQSFMPTYKKYWQFYERIGNAGLRFDLKEIKNAQY